MKRFALAALGLALFAATADAQLLPWRRAMMDSHYRNPPPTPAPVQPIVQQTDPALLAAINGQTQQLGQILAAMSQQQAAAPYIAQQAGPQVHYHYWQGGPYAGGQQAAPVAPPTQPIMIGGQQPSQPIIVLPQGQQTQPIAYLGGQQGPPPQQALPPNCPCPPQVQRGQGFDPDRPRIPIPAPDPSRPIINIPAPNPAAPIINIPAPNPNAPIINIPAPNPQAPIINIPAPDPQRPLIPIPGPDPYRPQVPIQGPNPYQPQIPIQGPDPTRPAIPLQPVNPQQPQIQMPASPNPAQPKIQLPPPPNPAQPGLIIPGPPPGTAINFQRYTAESPPVVGESRLPGLTGGPTPHESYRWSATPSAVPASR